MDCSSPASSVHGILQARILEWVAIPFSKGSFRPRDQTWVSCIAGGFFTIWASREALLIQFPQQHSEEGFILVWSLSCVQLFCDPKDCSPLSTSVCGISQARILEWVAISSFRGSFKTQESNSRLLQLLHWQEDSKGLALLSVTLGDGVIYLESCSKARTQNVHVLTATRKGFLPHTKDNLGQALQ